MYTYENYKIHKLIGDPAEAFYQLGLSDKNFLLQLLKHLEEITKSDQKIVDYLVEKSLDLYALYANANLAGEIPYLEDYLQGSGIHKNDFFKAMTYPEIMTALTQFMPLNLLQLACSSIFHLNQDGKMLHLRVLDFPLHDTYAKADRVLYSALTKKQKVLSLGPKGMPLHSLTAVNQSGLSLAIHQKFDKHFLASGTPIMMIAHEIISQAKSIKEAKRIAKKHQAIGSWGIQIGSKDGAVVSIEYSKQGVLFKEKLLEKGEFLYLNNQLFDIPFADSIPASINMYNHCRDNFFDQIMLKAKKRKKALTGKTLLELIQNESDKLNSQNKDKETLSLFTPSSVQIACFNLTDERADIITGEPPKHLSRGLLSIEDYFEGQKITETAIKTKTDQQIIRGQRELMQAQFAYDHKNIDHTYHHLQMATELLADHQLASVAHFFFNSISMIHLKNRKSLSDLYLKFENNKKDLPDYLKQQCILFQIRIQHILNLPKQELLTQLTNPILKQTWLNEENFPTWALQVFLKKSSQLRIDMFDIIYLHSKCGGN